MASLKIESHPFASFVPSPMKCLIIGSFPGKEQTRGSLDENAWFYGSPYNQLWRILEQAYDRGLKTKNDKQQLFEEAGIGMTDIFKSIIRTAGSNLDENLQIVEYNKDEIEKILKAFQPQVFCTSRFVEKEFKKMFPAYAAVDVLPSPSPRYFKLSIAQKAEIYKKKLPPAKKAD
ncbi:uracil-DNA glycosylase family protein [Flavisolibacter ginsenosidimutans]|uniref:Uracil-DNA glycosylase family protein n=1 Tax=Flavisolibacter ginsenosidimutans TaxID=661481 RepID=A0A5B8UQ63_9BACT|nr:uracil-DNA glycosylase family protein [Flavisolibacter ginsenosidimutans]QEC58095.1 uracil-DNA glycosylase family protein [Flavisolibacter ginsenosidimutans]